MNKIRSKLIDFLTRDCGVVINADNAKLENDGKNIIISIPHESFRKYGSTITTNTMGGITFEEGKGGFTKRLTPPKKQICNKKS